MSAAKIMPAVWSCARHLRLPRHPIHRLPTHATDSDAGADGRQPGADGGAALGETVVVAAGVGDVLEKSEEMHCLSSLGR